MTAFIRFACIMTVLATCCPPCPGQDVAAERLRDFQWFSSLGYPDVQGCRFVRVTAGWEYLDDNDKLQEHSCHGFIIAEQGDTFTILFPDLDIQRYRRKTGILPSKLRVDYAPGDFQAWARELANAPQREGSSTRDKQFRWSGMPLPEKTDVFIAAWACWRQGYDKEAAALYERAHRLWPFERRDGDKSSFAESLADDLAHAEMWEAVKAFGEPEVSRPALLVKFERIPRFYPKSEHVGRAKETATLLRQMIREDQEHAVRQVGAKPFAQLSRQEQVAELIFQLRDQNGSQVSQPGECNVFFPGDLYMRLLNETTPAHRLVEYGLEAIPQLIEALGDQRFTRSVGYHRDFYFSHHALRVGDAAEQIIARIAGRPFYQRTYTNGAMVKDGNETDVKKQIKRWHDTVKPKGDRQFLVEATEQGGDDSPSLGSRLLKKYPEAALPALMKGARTAKSPSVRTALVETLGKAPGEQSLAFLLAEVKEGPSLRSRLAAAEHLHARGRPEGWTAMLEEWESQKADPLKPDDFHFWETEREALAGFLLTSGKVQAIGALRKHWRKPTAAPQNPLGPTLVRIEGHWPGESQHPLLGDSPLRDPPEQLCPAIERLLYELLDDKTPTKIGMYRNQKEVKPRIGDLAAQLFHELDPIKYPFDLSAPWAERDRNIGLLKIIWRIEQRFPPLLVFLP